MKCRLYGDGSFDIAGNMISLEGCYPALDGIPIRPACIKMLDNGILYTLKEGTLRLDFSCEEDGRLSVTSRAEGIASVHDVSPFAGGRICGAAQVFVQGFGMEGPSGMFDLGTDTPSSHGLTALFKGEDALLLYAEDHTRYGISFLQEEQKTLRGACSVMSCTVDLEGTAGSSWETPAIFIEEAAGGEKALRHCASRIAAAMHARKVMPPAFFWSSWYYAYETMDEAMLDETILAIRDMQVPFRYLELDAGYAVTPGDWLIPHHRWPGGLAAAADKILGAGLGAGIWVAPFIVGDRSLLYREHPDWVLHDLEGRPVVRIRSYTEPKLWGNPDCNYYILDASHPEALAYLKKVFTTLRGFGFTLFKTDFMLWNMVDTSKVRRYDPTKTSVQILRTVLGTVREAIGEESYLLGCIAPFMPFIGYADGMRIAGDCGAQWREPYGPINMIREMPADSYFNHIYWQNDPDAILLRDFDTMLDPEEVWSLALLQALSGGAISTSDPVALLGEDRKRLLRLVEPHGPVTPDFPFFGKERRELVLTHRLPQGGLLFVMNPTDTPLTVVLRIPELFGSEEPLYTCRLSLNGEILSGREELLAEELSPHRSVLIFVSREPLDKAPENLWIW